MSKILTTNEKYRRFEAIIFKVWRVYEFGENTLTNNKIERTNKVFEQMGVEHPRAYKILIRQYLKHVYYTTMAREQGVSESYIRKLAKNGAYYFLKLYDKK